MLAAAQYVGRRDQDDATDERSERERKMTGDKYIWTEA